MHIIALDRLTEPSYPMLLSEILEKTHIKNKNLRTGLTNVLNVNKTFDVCVTYSNTVMCVSDGRTRAILAAVRSPRLLLDSLEDGKNRCFNSIMM